MFFSKTISPLTDYDYSFQVLATDLQGSVFESNVVNLHALTAGSSDYPPPGDLTAHPYANGIRLTWTPPPVRDDLQVSSYHVSYYDGHTFKDYPTIYDNYVNIENILLPDTQYLFTVSAIGSDQSYGHIAAVRSMLNPNSQHHNIGLSDSMSINSDASSNGKQESSSIVVEPAYIVQQHRVVLDDTIAVVSGIVQQHRIILSDNVANNAITPDNAAVPPENIPNNTDAPASDPANQVPSKTLPTPSKSSSGGGSSHSTNANVSPSLMDRKPPKSVSNGMVEMWMSDDLSDATIYAHYGIKSQDKIPDWVKEAAQWHLEDKVSKSEFTNILAYLASLGVQN